MANHQNFYYWLKNVVSIQEGCDKDFFSIRDKSDNDITFYDMTNKYCVELLREHCRIFSSRKPNPKPILPHSVKVVRVYGF